MKEEEFDRWSSDREEDESSLPAAQFTVEEATIELRGGCNSDGVEEGYEGNQLTA